MGLWLFRVITLGVAGSFLPLGVFVYLKNPHSKVHRNFFGFNTLISFWSLGFFLTLFSQSPPSVALWASRLSHLCGGLTVVFFLRFVLLFLGLDPKKLRDPLFIVLAVTAALSCFSPWMVTGLRPKLFFPYYPEPGPLYLIFLLNYFYGYIKGFYYLIRAYRTGPGVGQHQIQAILIFLAVLIGWLNIATLFLPIYNFKFTPFLGFLPVFAVISIYAILRHQLLDIRVVIRKTIFYSLLAFMITALYVIVIFFIHTFILKQEFFSHYAVNSVALILLLALFLKPMETFLHRLLDKRFFRGTIAEISEQKQQLETELERRERLKSVGILAAGMAHEIKNPLTAIKTFAEFLPEKYNDPEFRDKFSRIVTREVARVGDIVTNLLLFSKPTEPALRSCDVRSILSDLVELLSNELVKHRIKVHLDLGGNNAWADPDQIKQALLNILMNAIDAMKSQGGELWVKTFSEDSFLGVSIEDTGCGIPEEKLKNIFDPFYTDKEQGTGLGLAVTHSILEKNKGTITVESQVGKGTRFVIRLPLAK